MISELRFVERNGKIVLQQHKAIFHGDASGALCGVSLDDGWENVPFVPEDLTDKEPNQ
jgi:hypothetical protein